MVDEREPGANASGGLGGFRRSPAHPGGVLGVMAGALLVAWFGVGVGRGAALRDGPIAPGEAERSFVLDPGLRIELAAAEPLVQSPSALAWDENGRLFVAENPGYPVGPGAGEAPVGKLVELVDGNGDGRADQRVEFAGGLSFPNGLMPWRGGWLVTDAPDLLWLADTNRDGRADVREVWWTGFATNQTTQLRACYPVLGPDGWIYVARGLVGGVVRSPKWTNLPPVDLKGGDFRFRPDGSAAEATGGNAQFGQVLDDLGRRFTVSNRNPLMHVVVEPRWWARNPWVPMTDLVQDVSPVGYEAKVHPTSPDLTTAGFIPDLMAAPHAGTFTAACGIHQYHGEALGDGYSGNWFICEPAQNLVQRQVTEAVGGTFRSHPVPAGRDFLTSRDPWFRPVYLATGPDGGLYMADMYRKVIDHPAYLPEDARGKLDFQAGKDLGRLWRVRRGAGAAAEIPGHGNELTWIRLLGSTNGWVRQTAFRLLVERGAGAVLESLLARSARPENKGGPGPVWAGVVRREADAGEGRPWERIRRTQLIGLALEGDEGRDKATADPRARAQAELISATLDESPEVRVAAWRVFQRLATRQRARGESRGGLPEVAYELVRWWAEDPNPAARFAFALVAGEQTDWSPVIPALAAMARRDGADRWTRAAVLSGVKGREIEFAEALARGAMDQEEEVSAVMGDVGRMIAANPTGELSRFLEMTTGTAWSGRSWVVPALRGVLLGWRSRGQGAVAEMLNHLEDKGGRSTRIREVLREAGAGAVREAASRSLAAGRRVDAIQFLGELEPEAGGEVLIALAREKEPLDVPVAAVHALGRLGMKQAARRWVERGGWDVLPMPVREAVLSELTSRGALTPVLLEALERGDLPLWSVDAGRRRQLQSQGDPALRERAKRLWADAGGADRRRVYEELKEVIGRAAEGNRGQQVFLKACAPCHQLDGQGARVGPDLTGIRNQPAEALLLHIVVPDVEIAAGYQATEIETKDGRVLTGLVVGETGGSVTLRWAGGAEETLQKSGIATQSLSRVSLMPQELEKTMSRQELADLLGYLKGAR